MSDTSNTAPYSLKALTKSCPDPIALSKEEATASLLRQAVSKDNLDRLAREREAGLEQMAKSILSAGVPYVCSDYLNCPFGILVSRQVMDKINELTGDDL